jgi:hypothetical protein
MSPDRRGLRGEHGPEHDHAAERRTVDLPRITTRCAESRRGWPVLPAARRASANGREAHLSSGNASKPEAQLVRAIELRSPDQHWPAVPACYPEHLVAAPVAGVVDLFGAHWIAEAQLRERENWPHWPPSLRASELRRGRGCNRTRRASWEGRDMQRPVQLRPWRRCRRAQREQHGRRCHENEKTQAANHN